MARSNYRHRTVTIATTSPSRCDEWHTSPPPSGRDPSHPDVWAGFLAPVGTDPAQTVRRAEEGAPPGVVPLLAPCCLGALASDRLAADPYRPRRPLDVDPRQAPTVTPHMDAMDIRREPLTAVLVQGLGDGWVECVHGVGFPSCMPAREGVAPERCGCGATSRGTEVDGRDESRRRHRLADQVNGRVTVEATVVGSGVDEWTRERRRGGADGKDPRVTLCDRCRGHPHVAPPSR